MVQIDMTALAADTPCATLDEQLRAWFDSLVQAPVPDRLIQHLEALTARSSGPRRDETRA